MRNARYVLAALVASAACGGNDGPTTNLKPVFFRTIYAAPVATFTLQRQNGAAMDKARVSYDTRAMFDGAVPVGATTTSAANASGVAALALPAGTYSLSVLPNAGNLVGAFQDSISIGQQDVSRVYQTSQQNWTVTSQKAFSAVSITILQVDGNGRALVGAGSQTTNPIVLSASVPAPGGNATSVTFSTELFKGSYRAVIGAVPVTSTDVIAPFETQPFGAAGGGATEPQAVALVSGGNVVSLHFMEAGAPVADSQISGVAVYDANTLAYLGGATSTNGVATVATGAVTNVIAIVGGPNGSTLSAAAYTASPTHSATLTRSTLSGHAKTPDGAALAQTNSGNYGTVSATLQAGLGDYWQNQLFEVRADVTDALGSYAIKLFAGAYNLRVKSLKTLPASPIVAVNVNPDVPTQDLALEQGGVITGNVQDQAHNNVQGLHVSVGDAAHLPVGSAVTDSSGNFSIPVPYGTYNLGVGGALTRNVGVSPSAPTATLNLTQFQITGRLTDVNAAPVAGRVLWGGGSANASSLGTYTINVVEGINWFLFTPPASSPSLGFAYETNALVDANTVKSLQ